ncbi:hypothetical protein GGX14DRAFT_309849, partial [Mycena pura]
PVNFAFAYLSSTYQVVEMTPGDATLWAETTALKSRNPALKVFLSIGGWSFNDPPTSGIFSSLVASSENIGVFIPSVVSVMQAYGFDGIDIDWEYPGAPDRGGSSADTENYANFIRRVKAVFSGYGYSITFTAPSSYWYLQNFDLPSMLDEGGADWVNVMTYDLHGTWDSPADYIGSIVLAHTNLTEIEVLYVLFFSLVGIDPSKIVMGIGFYGRSFELADAGCVDPGCPFAGAAPAGPCSVSPGTLMYTEIEDIVNSNAVNDVIFDSVAAVKYVVYNGIDWVSYDDEQTLALKMNYANSICLSGTMVWSLDQHGTPPTCLDIECPVGSTTLWEDFLGDASTPCTGNARNYCCDTPSVDTFIPVPANDVFPMSEVEGNVVDYDDNEGTPDDTTTGDGSAGLGDDGLENDSPFSSVFIASPNAASVSSLDTESDWVLSDCDPTSDQPQSSVTATCTCPMDDEDCGCAHVLIGKAYDTIVKLPSNCGLGPYGRVVFLELRPDQSGHRADGGPGYSLAFDYAFTDIAEENGPIYMRADMTDMPGYWDSIIDSPPDGSTTSVRKRDLNFHQPRGVNKRWWGSFTNWYLFRLNQLNTLTSKDSVSRNFHWSDSYTIFSQSESCPNFQSSLDITVSGSASIDSQFGYYLEATIVPPAVQQAYVYFKAGAGAQATFTITGVAAASWDSGRTELISFGFPGLYYPGLLTLGPSLHLYGELSGSLSLSGMYQTTVGYTFPGIDLSFGKEDSNAGTSQFSNGVSPNENNQGFNYNMGWNVELAGQADAHLIPSLQLGISVLGGTILDAEVFVEADIYAGLSVSGSVSNTVAPQICVTPEVGVNLNAGLMGSILLWEPSPLSTSLYSTEFTWPSTCFGSVTQPSSSS